MSLKQSEIESIVDSVIEDVIEIAFAGNFNNRKEAEYAIEYLKTKIEEFDPTDFLE